LVAPAFLAGLARLAHRLPATLRLATRDAARHRHRTGPATAAIAVAVGGAVAISCLIASDQNGTGLHAPDALPDRAISIAQVGAVDQSFLEPATQAVKEAVPDAQVLQVKVPVRQEAEGCVDMCTLVLNLVEHDSSAREHTNLRPWIGVGDPDL